MKATQTRKWLWNGSWTAAERQRLLLSVSDTSECLSHFVKLVSFVFFFVYLLLNNCFVSEFFCSNNICLGYAGLLRNSQTWLMQKWISTLMFDKTQTSLTKWLRHSDVSLIDRSKRCRSAAVQEPFHNHFRVWVAFINVRIITYYTLLPNKLWLI
jgi:hypothetical protein